MVNTKKTSQRQGYLPQITTWNGDGIYLCICVMRYGLWGYTLIGVVDYWISSGIKLNRYQ